MTDYSTLSYFKRGKRRQAVLKTLEKDPKTPKELAMNCKISISNVSNTLAELSKDEYVECINPKDHTYKYYTLTNKGKKALNLLNLSK